MRTLGKNNGEELSQAASHLMAELHAVRDLHAQGEVSTDTLRHRVRVIRARVAAWSMPLMDRAGVAVALSSASQGWSAVMESAERLKTEMVA